MQQKKRLSTWQVSLIIIGTFLVLAPIVWDMLTAVFTSLADIQLEEILTRGGMLAVGIILLIAVGVAEIYKDFRDKPTSKHIR